MIVCKTIFLIIILIVFFLFFFIQVTLFKTGLIYTSAKKLYRIFQDCFYVYQLFKVPQHKECMQHNQLYRKVSLYLHSLPSIENSDFTNLVTGKNQNDIVPSLDPNQTIEDHFLGATVFWFNHTTTFLLKIRKSDKRRILRPYLHHIHTVADQIENQRKRDLRLFINENGRWRSVPFTHPSTFDTMAMETDLKNKIKSNLESFLRAKQYYRRLGRVWKRSFLLYGPSGTGKSSFVAAMANFLCYDVYDIVLSKVSGDSDLKFLLLETTAKSIVVMEDLDRFLTEKSTAMVQNVMDGILSSCCGEERVMVFTMNSKERVDPNVLRPGRVDVHIHFPVCDFSAFKTLARSYLGVKEHKLFPRVHEIFLNGASLSPAEIAELMIANRNSPSRAIKSVIGALQTDGDGRGCGKIGRPLGDDVDEDPRVQSLCGEVKDLRKLYGFFRLRNERRSPSSNSLAHDREIVDTL